MDQARGKPPTPAQNSTTRPVAAYPPAPMVHPSDEGVFKAAPSLKGGRKGRIQRRLERLEWLYFDDKCNRFDALSCSSTLVSFFTSVQVSCADISPSFSHLMLDNSAGDIKGSRGFFNLRNVVSMWPLPLSDVT